MIFLLRLDTTGMMYLSETLTLVSAVSLTSDEAWVAFEALTYAYR